MEAEDLYHHPVLGQKKFGLGEDYPLSEWREISEFDWLIIRAQQYFPKRQASNFL